MPVLFNKGKKECASEHLVSLAAQQAAEEVHFFLIPPRILSCELRDRGQ